MYMKRKTANTGNHCEILWHRGKQYEDQLEDRGFFISR